MEFSNLDKLSDEVTFPVFLMPFVDTSKIHEKMMVNGKPINLGVLHNTPLASVRLTQLFLAFEE